MQNRKPILVAVVLALGVASISFGSILVRFGQEAPSLVIALYRMGWASVLLFPFYLYKSPRLPQGRWSLRILAGVALALHFAFWISSLRYTTIAVSVLLVNTSPVLVAASSYILFRERLTVRGLTGLALSLTGCLVLFWNDLSRLGDWRGPTLALLGAAMLGIYLLSGRSLRSKGNLLDYIYPTYAIASGCLLIVVLVADLPVGGFSFQTHLYLFLLGLVPQVLGHSSYNWALRYIPATKVSVLILAEPIGASILAWWLLGEGLSSMVMIGACLVGLGLLLVTRWGIRPRENDRESY